MHVRQMDFRESWIRELFLGLEQAFVNVDKNLSTIEYYDGLFAKEQIETILGIAFVTAQTYIMGTISDIRSTNKGNNQKKKSKIISSGTAYVVNKITQIELVDSIANYYKHNDEWDHWKINKHNKVTIEKLMKCGISSETEFPCYETAKMLWPEKEINELSNLIKVLKNWREKVIGERVTLSAVNT